MKGPPIDAAKEAAAGVLQALEPGDYISLISFGTKAKVLLPLTQAGDKARPLSAIGRLEAKGTTHLYEALYAAVDAMQNFQNVIPRIVLLTDGWPTDVKDPSHYQTLAADSFRSGIPIATVGVGNYNDVVLRAISDSAGGWWEHATALNRISPAFRSELNRARQTAVRQPILWLLLAPGSNLLEAHMARPLARQVDIYQTDAGLYLELPDIIGNTYQDYVLRVDVPEVDRPGRAEILRVTLSDQQGYAYASAGTSVDFTKDEDLVRHTEVRPSALYSLTRAIEKATIAVERGDQTLAEEARAEAETIMKDPRTRAALDQEEEGKTKAVIQSSGAVAAGGQVDSREAISKMRKG